MRRVVFLPGAAGAAEFWQPVAARLPASWETELLAWSGLGSQPPAPDVRGFDDLVRLARARSGRPSDLVAQSLGGVVAIRVALACPELVRRLVLVATSGGVDVAALGAADWRDDYVRAHPGSARWILGPAPDLVSELPSLVAPTLLLWGEADPISPLAVGERLAGLLPRATLRVISGGGHDLAVTHADEVAELVREHLEN